MEKMKISIVTTTYNSAATIADTLRSVADQSYNNIEHVIVDGASTDNTLDIVSRFPHVSTVISEKDKGIYNAMNKGFRLATGDYIGILNSDDFFTDDKVIERVASVLSDPNIDAVIGDAKVVDKNNIEKVVRYSSAKNWTPRQFLKGIMPAHASYYARKSVYDQHGLFREDYKICADYELMVRHIHHGKLNYKYMDMCFVTMRAGGASNGSLRKIIDRNKEIMRAIRQNGLKTNVFRMATKFVPRMMEFVKTTP